MLVSKGPPNHPQQADEQFGVLFICRNLIADFARDCRVMQVAWGEHEVTVEWDSVPLGYRRFTKLMNTCGAKSGCFARPNSHCRGVCCRRRCAVVAQHLHASSPTRPNACQRRSSAGRSPSHSYS